MIEILLNIIITAVLLFLIFKLGMTYATTTDSATGFFTMLSTILISVLAAVSAMVLYISATSSSIEEQCKENSISYTLVSTIAEETGESEKDVYTICKYAATADMDLYDVVLLIDPDLTEDEAGAIITISD